MLLYRAGQASNALLWGLGNDSGMWNFVNRGGRTTFLENHSHWIAQVQAQIPGEHPGEIYERGWIWCAHTGEVERLDTIPCYARRAKPCVYREILLARRYRREASDGALCMAGIEAYHVKYQHVLPDHLVKLQGWQTIQKAKRMLITQQEVELLVKLPARVADEAWDVILVDSPLLMRMEALWTTRRLLNDTCGGERHTPPAAGSHPSPSSLAACANPGW